MQNLRNRRDPHYQGNRHRRAKRVIDKSGERNVGFLHIPERSRRFLRDFVTTFVCIRTSKRQQIDIMMSLFVFLHRHHLGGRAMAFRDHCVCDELFRVLDFLRRPLVFDCLRSRRFNGRREDRRAAE